MSTTQIDKILNIYNRLYQIPSFTSARIITRAKNGPIIQSYWSQKNFERRLKQKFIQEYILDVNLHPVTCSFPIDISTELMVAFSDDDKYKAVLRDVIADGKSKQFIEIWNNQHLIKSYDLSAYEIHGDVYTEPTFSSFQWSFDKTRLLYIAEKKLPKSESFYKQKSKPKPKTDNEEPSRGTEYIFKPDWGEQLVGKHRSVVIVLNINEDTIEPITSIPDEFFPAQVIWAPNDNDIIGVAYKIKSKYLGLYACTNRESYIFHLKNKDFCKLTEEGLFCSSPRLSPNGKNLIWLERNITAAHHDVHRLMYLKWDNLKQPNPLINLVKTNAIIAEHKKFYGLYNHSLPKRCWDKDSKYIFISTPQRSNIKSYVVNVETKIITEIQNEDNSSLIVIDVNDNVVAFINQSLIKPPQVMIGQFNSQSSNLGTLNLVSCSNSFSIPEGENLFYEHTEYVHTSDETINDFNFTYFGKRSELLQSVPLIAVAHGGPHSSYSNIFIPDYAVFALLGFGILHINYRGSTGMGGDNVHYLLGKVGEADVFDCVTAINTTIEKYSWIDPKRINLYGGSHGGFLGAHLSGQFPDKFKAVALLNPVIDIAAMFSVTDIPDWCLAESGFYIFDNLTQPRDLTKYNELIVKMLKHSPIIHADKVKAPTLVALGSKDLRVPFSQGKLWYNRLKDNNVKTKLFIYDDNHSLRKDEVDIDNFINVVLWFIEHNDM